MSSLQPNVYAVLSRCVEEGLSAGWHRAHKHTNAPKISDILGQQEAAIMLAITEYFTFADGNAQEAQNHADA